MSKLRRPGQAEREAAAASRGSERGAARGGLEQREGTARRRGGAAGVRATRRRGATVAGCI